MELQTLLTGQLAELEERNAKLESQNGTVIQQNLELQQVERELRDNLLTFVSHSELQDVQNKLLKSEQERVCAPITCWSEHTPKTEVTHLEHFVKIWEWNKII